MTYLILLLLIALSLAVLGVLLALRDGRGPQQPPRSHVQDGRFLAPGGR